MKYVKKYMKIRDFSRLVKIQHSIFALPFLLGGVFLAPGWQNLEWTKWLAMLAAMIAARNAAMGFNRLVDAQYDSRNPRTANREIPAGILSRNAVTLFVLFNAAIFIGAAYFLNIFALAASPFVLAILLVYSYTKRFTWMCHFVLGFGIGLAPSAGWVAITGSLDWQPVALSGALMFYIAGFDLLYATQDADFDRDQNLHSIPARFGVSVSLWIARFCHLISFIFFLLVGHEFALSFVYWLGVGVILVLMIAEHSLVRKDDLSRVPFAFFHINSVISVIVGLAIAGGVFIGK